MITDIRYSNSDSLLHAKLLGHIDIYGKDLDDLKVAAKEAFECFIIAANKHGRGLEEELRDLLD